MNQLRDFQLREDLNKESYLRLLDNGINKNAWQIRETSPSILTTHLVSLIYLSILKTNTVDELFKHRIPRSVNVLGESQINLPGKSTVIRNRNWGNLRLHYKSVEFSSPMTWPCQLPSHGSFGFRVHVKIEPQMGDTTFGKMQIKSKTRAANFIIHIETFELCRRGFHEICMDI